MNDWTASQIKELVKVEVEAERRLRDALRAEDREKFDEYKKVAAKALDLQAAEYERRLDVLNHAHEEARSVLGTYLTRELYERAHGEVVEWQRKGEIRNVEFDGRLKKVELGLVDLPGGVKSLELGLASQNAHSLGARMTMTAGFTIVGVAIAAVGGLIAVLNYLRP